MTCRAGAILPEAMAISHPISARIVQFLGDTSSAMTRADLVGTTAKGTKTFGRDRRPDQTTAAERFENPFGANQQDLSRIKDRSTSTCCTCAKFGRTRHLLLR